MEREGILEPRGLDTEVGIELVDRKTGTQSLVSLASVALAGLVALIWLGW